MTKIGYLSRTMRTVLLATVLIPAPLLAEPAATARQMLTQAQTRAQDHAVKSEVEKITERGPVPRETPAVKSFSSNLQEPSAIPAVSALTAQAIMEPPSEPMLTALRYDSTSVPSATTADPPLALHAPAYQVASIAPWETPKRSQVDTASIITSLAPATAADTAQVVAPVLATTTAATTSHDSPAIAPAPETQPATIEIASEKTDRATGSTIPARNEPGSETGRNVASKSEVAVKPAIKKTTASTRIANSSPDTYQRHARAKSGVEFADSNIRTQLRRIVSRPEVRSLMAQYGLN